MKSLYEQKAISEAPQGLTSCQSQALDILYGHSNVFLSGAAGTGKSYLIRQFLQGKGTEEYPVVASTGAAAILIEGRTFHSFFGLGIMEGGVQATIQRAIRNKKLLNRLVRARCIVIDEISMLSGATLRAAETITKYARRRDEPWGGLRVITVGDFAQLPPVNTFGNAKDWAFLDETWIKSSFTPALLRTIVRTREPEFLRVVNAIRQGVLNDECIRFLNGKVVEPEPEFEGTRLFPLRRKAEQHNLDRLDKIHHALHRYETNYTGQEPYIELLRKNAPIPELLQLKVGALVMMRKNDTEGGMRWVNGSLGRVVTIKQGKLKIELLNGLMIEVGKTNFSMLDADGNMVATAWNFPVNLAWATTIHKAQGASLDRLMVDLSSLWEPGQAYVALSRVRSADGLFIERWNPGSIIVEPLVTKFYAALESSR